MTLNKAIFLNTLRYLMDAPVRLVIAGLLLLILYAFVGGGVIMNEVPVAGVSGLVAGGNSLVVLLLWLLGLGLISRDISSGSLQLVLLRPLTRATYVLAKWAALAAVGVGVLLFVHLAFLAHHGLDSVDAQTLALIFAAQCLQVAAVTAVIALFSTVPINFGELGLLILCAVVFAVLKLLNLKYEVELLDQALSLAWRILLPKVAFSPGADGTQDLLLSLGINAAVALAALGGAMRLMWHREFTYAEQAAG